MARILIVDDNPSVLQTLMYCLGQAGHTLLTATDGASGLEIARTSEPDLAIVDVEMPKMRGLAVCRGMKGDPRTARIPVIMITGATSSEIQRDAMAAGAMAVIPKPFDIDALLELIVGAQSGSAQPAPAGTPPPDSVL
jgi:twitching motility two-component system response regulator PilH